MTQVKTKKALSLQLTKGAASLEKLFGTSSWKAGFARLLKAPWRTAAPSPAGAVDELRARVEHHMLNGKATAADALLTAASEDPELYRQALIGVAAKAAGAGGGGGATKTATKKRSSARGAR